MHSKLEERRIDHAWNDRNLRKKIEDFREGCEYYMRLIDADKLENNYIPILKQTQERNRNVKSIACKMYDLLCKEKTIDAVEVVRCKDCRYLIDREDGTHGCYIYLGYDAKLDGFCSHGKKE